MTTYPYVEVIIHHAPERSSSYIGDESLFVGAIKELPRSQQKRIKEYSLKAWVKNPAWWEHTMYCELGRSITATVSRSKSHPFGVAGKDYDSDYRVESLPLYHI